MKKWTSVCTMFAKLMVLFTLIAEKCGATFNLYLKAEEWNRTVGLAKELYYVTEGMVNDYALNFVVTIPSEMDTLYFTWESLGQQSLPYTISITYSDHIAMIEPKLNISKKGKIPTNVETFSVYLPCSGTRDAEVNVDISFNVTAYPRLNVNSTNVTLKRKKICLSDPSVLFKHLSKEIERKNNPVEPNQKKDGKSKESMNNNEFVEMKSHEYDKYANIVIGSMIGVFFIVLAMAAAVSYRTRRRAPHPKSDGFLHVDTTGRASSSYGSSCGTGSGSRGEGSIFIRTESPHHYSTPCIDSSNYSYSIFPQIPYYSEISSSTLGSDSYKLAEMTIDRCKVRLQCILMEGTYSRVYKATIQEYDGKEEKVIVKTVSEASSPLQMAALRQEGLSLINTASQHVHAVIKLTNEERAPPFLIYQDTGFRNLKKFLQRCRSGPGRPVTTQEIVSMVIQIASGLAYLHRQNIIHRDVASRNAVVDDKMVVKLSDSALSRDLFPEDYNCLGDSESRPIKWLPPESILQSRFNAAVDLWSFGVTVWELATLAQQPYNEIDPPDLFPFLKMGYRLSQPINCPDELYAAMAKCWTWDPDDRPKLVNIIQELHALHAQLALYV